ncbi:hypothetical protein [uncultured Paraglaciecola sp.]|uniref:hypothetical protein n=1 Tax=uncultured Paraglaciecola sp. TaxID=1765024 RepID=UPI002636CE2D|nr:hypothetical protein [uncultured Paraglaciecola sp.]
MATYTITSTPVFYDQDGTINRTEYLGWGQAADENSNVYDLQVNDGQPSMVKSYGKYHVYYAGQFRSVISGIPGDWARMFTLRGNYDVFPAGIEWRDDLYTYSKDSGAWIVLPSINQQDGHQQTTFILIGSGAVYQHNGQYNPLVWTSQQFGNPDTKQRLRKRRNDEDALLACVAAWLGTVD